MVVRLHLEDNRETVANVNGPGVLTRALQDGWAGRWQPLQERPRIGVASVLTPHRGDHAQLNDVRLSAEKLDRLVKLGLGQPSKI